MIKVVLFDLGDTLVCSYPEVTFRRILKEQGVAKSLSQVKNALIRGNMEFDIDKHIGLSVHEFYTQWNLVQLKHLGLKGSKVGKLAEQIDTQWWRFAEFYVYPDVEETLHRLKQMNLKLGIITGGFEEDIEMILPKLGLSAFFEVKVGANTTGRRKPHRAAFIYALKQLDVKPREAMFVGDNFEADYLGAKKVGMVPVLIKRRGSPIQRKFTDICTKVPLETRTIERLDEIFEILKEVSL